MTRTPSRHATSLTNGDVVQQSDLGSITRVTADTFPFTNADPLIVPRVNPVDARGAGEPA